MECHVEIKRRVAARAGFHARNYTDSVNETDCTRCHVEHNGRKFPLIQLERKDFNHATQTGFALEGKHRQKTCESCHNAKHITAEAKAEIKLSNKDHSFLGLRRECTTCHTDQHRGQLGTECVRCHSQDAWKPAPGFSHTKTAFALTGQHQSVACQNCHGPKAADQAARYKGLSFNGCQSCHTDPHKGAFQDAKVKGGCETCHTTNGWKNNRPSQSFNHAGTPFPLAGKHAALVCDQCHKSSDFRRPIAHEKCADCHQDQHSGQFAARAAGADCSACHNESGFKPTLFTRQTHQQSKFRLEGKHESLECSQCHLPAGKETAYVLRKSQCAECHADPHQSEFAGAPHNNRCENCHSQNAFKPALFSQETHNKSRFPLEGSHTAVACYDCHKPLAGTAGAPAPQAAKMLAAKIEPGAARRYHFESRQCTACHTDPHKIDAAYAGSCETCHVVQKWNKAEFDHSRAKFALAGAHAKVECVKCHQQIPFMPAAALPSAAAKAGAAKTVPGFAKLGANCYGCHQDPHAGQFRAGEPEKDCGSCHSMNQWAMPEIGLGAFDHNRTRFPMDRAHVNVRCEKCHAEQGQVNGKPMRKYRGTALECTQCH
ncbi:MAG: cytochrome c3 family protein [Bryobacteraceae bacterium]